MKKNQNKSVDVEKKPTCEIDGVKYVVSCYYTATGESIHIKIQEALKTKYPHNKEHLEYNSAVKHGIMGR